MADFLEAVFYPNTPPSLTDPTDRKFMTDEFSPVGDKAIQFTIFTPSSTVRDYIQFFDPEDGSKTLFFTTKTLTEMLL